MSAAILNGNLIRDQIYSELRAEIAALLAAGVRPGLAAVQVGDNPASQLYVSSKIAACGKLGLASFHVTPPASFTTTELLTVVNELNRRDDVDGILVQMPLPAHVDPKKILDAVNPAKDVDGFHPLNVGRLVAGRPAFAVVVRGPIRRCGQRLPHHCAVQSDPVVSRHRGRCGISFSTRTDRDRPRLRARPHGLAGTPGAGVEGAFPAGQFRAINGHQAQYHL